MPVDGSIWRHRNLGFLEEGRLRRMIYTDGHYHDEFVLGMTAEELWNAKNEKRANF
jgi:RimJ/RimL family protein N-acetyltransferase